MTKEDRYYIWQYVKLIFPVACLLIALTAELIAIVRLLLALRNLSGVDVSGV